MGERDAWPAQAAGAAAGLTGLGVFLVLHHIWITPIWFIAPVGALLATGGGAIAGRAYVELLPSLPARPWRAVAVAAIFGLTLLPAALIAEATGPLVELQPGGRATFLAPGATVAVAFAGGLVGSAAVTGLAAGAAVGRTRRSAGWTALAGVALAVGPGHNVPMLGGSPAAPQGIGLLLAVVLVASIMLVEAHHRLGRPVAS